MGGKMKGGEIDRQDWEEKKPREEKEEEEREVRRDKTLTKER